jgi:ribose transport system substrate-binding protein
MSVTLSRCGAVLALISVVVLTACGGSGGGGDVAGGAGGPVTVPAYARGYQPPASGCGSFTAPAPPDPEGAIADLDTVHQKAYGGYMAYPNANAKITKSPWAGWKPTHAPPYKVAVLWGPLTTDWQVQATDNIQKFLKRSPMVSGASFASSGNTYDVGAQLQDYDTIVRRHPDLIILQPLTPESFIGPIEKAAKVGIPTVTLVSYAATPSQVAVDTNPYLGAATTASYATKALGGKGNVVYVEGISGSSVDAPSESAWNNVLKSCPGMRTSKDKVYASFAQATAKQEMLKYIGTHPDKIDAVFESEVMATGVMQAFAQSGRPMPLVPDIGLTKGSLGYWRQHDAKYDNAGQGIVPVGAARAVVEVSLRMLDGQGVKINHVVDTSPLVTDANIDGSAQADWSLNTPGTLGGTEQGFMPSSYLDDFFAHPAAVKLR